MKTQQARSTSPVETPQILPKPNLDAMEAAAEHMDKLRDEIRKRHGVQSIGVQTIRQMRCEVADA